CRMSRFAVLRVLACIKDAWDSDTASGASWRRPSLSQTREPDRSTGSHGCLVRQVFEVTTVNDEARMTDDEGIMARRFVKTRVQSSLAKEQRSPDRRPA